MTVTRRALLTTGLAAAVGAVTACARPAGQAQWGQAEVAAESAAGPAASPSARALPRPVPRPAGSAVGGSLVNNTPLSRALVSTLSRYLKPTPDNPKHPWFAGAVALVTVSGQPVGQAAVGHALRYGAGPVELAAAKRVAMRLDSVFDQASVTKVYTSVLLLQQVDKGKVDLDAKVVDYLPEFTGAGKDAVTVAMLLTHTSGLPVGATVAGLSASAQRTAVLATPLVKGAVPGNTYRYSSVGLMVAAYLVEKVTGQTLDKALKSGLTDPLGLRYTGFKPLTWMSAADKTNLLVATDARSSRGLLRGTVHDDVCNQMGGIAGHAGIFSSASDLAVIGQMLLNGGTYNGKRVLAAATVERMLTNANKGLPAIDPDRPTRTADHGLGVVLGQPWFMGKLSSPKTFGHTGFTGTSIVVDPARKMVFVLLTNRAHPNWTWSNPDPMRAAVANVVASTL